jgi:hypothetical protein
MNSVNNNIGKKRTKLFWNENKLEVYRLNQDQENNAANRLISPTNNNKNSATSPSSGFNKNNNIDMIDVTI